MPTTVIVEKLPAANASSSDKFALFRTKKPKIRKVHGRDCYRSDHIDTDSVKLFDNVLERRPQNGSNIFFHETSCLDGGVARLSVRQACTIESAAVNNPNTSVFLLFVSPAGYERDQPWPELFEVLATYPNVHVRNAGLWSYTAGTPAEQFVHGPELFTSDYLAVHMSDMMRLISVFRWGGTHIDLDFVLRRSMEQLPPNFAAYEAYEFVSNAVFNFASDGIGHLIAEHLVREFVNHFNPHEWAANGPALLKREFEKLCVKNDLKVCPLLKIYPKESFYPVYGTVWEKLMDKEHAAESMALMQDSYGVHMWNALSSGGSVKIGDGSAYEQLARQFCPKVFATIKDDHF